jgi:integrase
MTAARATPDMPPANQGSVYQLGPRRYGIRYIGPDGVRRKQSPFASKTEAREWFARVVAPTLRGEQPQKPDLTLSEFVTLYLDRHEADVRPRTIATLRERLGHATKRFGDIPLSEFQRMTDEVAAWRSRQPSGVAYGRTGALRQCLAAAVRWGYIDRNPAVLAGKNRQPAPRTVRVFTRDELALIVAELSPTYQSIPTFAAATGLRPEEWMALERRDIDRHAGVLNVRRTVSSGEVVELGKTSRSRRQVPLSSRALAVLDALPPRLDTPLLWTAPEGGLLDLNNWRYREWTPAVESAGVAKPARVYDLRSTFASTALAAGLSAFELAKVMGTSVECIERSYGSLLDGAATGIAARLSALEAAS